MEDPRILSQLAQLSVVYTMAKIRGGGGGFKIQNTFLSSLKALRDFRHNVNEPLG
jgi:hypothetical protein